MLASQHPPDLTLHLPDEAATDALGAVLAPALAPGDILLLRGDLGAGKSALSRAAIQTLLGDPGADVPSPSYTLVNIYETSAGPVWHIDLYRLAGDSDEMAELGLDEAMGATTGAAILLIEWPERLGNALPARRLEFDLHAPATGGRVVTVAFHGDGWNRVASALRATQ